MDRETQRVVFTDDARRVVADEVARLGPDRLLVLTDTNTRRLCLPLMETGAGLPRMQVIEIGAGDGNKTLDSLAHVWSEMQRHGATRHSMVVNVGGGMVTDLGGMAASTFKRGMAFVNVPTTLLAMVDASVGGKTGINFGGLKNEIGVFSNAECVVVDTGFLKTLDGPNLLSGYAEMLKHGLLADRDTWAGLLTADLTDLGLMGRMVERSVAVKQRIVDADPTEHGLRKALNLGHTFGHAFESLSLTRDGGARPLLHGHAVAFGLVCELYLSCMKAGLPVADMRQTVQFITAHYGRPDITCDDYRELLDLMTHDKKNTAGVINFTLLSAIGCPLTDQTATQAEIEEALDFVREG